MKNLKDRINKLLEDKVKPYLHIDGGDIELVDIDKEGIATIRFKGACFECPLKQMTLRGGVERVIMQNVVQIKRLEEG